jgi:cyanate permease
MLTTFANGCAFYATLYYLPTFFQVVRGASAIRSGVLLLPLVIVQTLCAFLAGILVSKTGDYWWNMTLGFSIWTVGLGMLSTIGPETSEAKLAGYQVLVGVGAGQTFQTSLIAIQASVERKDMAVATGLRNFLRMLGGTVALTVCSTIINNIVSSQLRSAGLSEDLLREVLNAPTMLSSSLSDTQRTAVLAAYCEGYLHKSGKIRLLMTS